MSPALSLASDSKSLRRDNRPESGEIAVFSGYFTQNQQKTPVIA
jgi:hypothetical protein